jgi:hypothetical protein
MRFDDYRTSGNVERGSPGRGGFGGGMGGAGLGMLISFVFSRFGIVGVLVVVGLMFFLGGNPLGVSGGGQQSPTSQSGSVESAEQVCDDSSIVAYSCRYLASTEDRWSELFQQAGSTYQPPRMVIYDSRGTNSGCGAAQSAMGPFYCPTDQKIYIDPQFFQDLAQRHAAPGDFAQAYVIAHEVGHHVQTITGTADRIRAAQSRMSQREGNALQVRMELQADCYAGLWAARSRERLESGDLEEGMTAAAAIGDDTLQRAGQGHVVPESFTHGTSAQRQEALLRGFQGGNPAACDTYTAGI